MLITTVSEHLARQSDIAIGENDHLSRCIMHYTLKVIAKMVKSSDFGWLNFGVPTYDTLNGPYLHRVDAREFMKTKSFKVLS